MTNTYFWEGREYTKDQLMWQIKEFENKGTAPQELYDLLKEADERTQKKTNK